MAVIRPQQPRVQVHVGEREKSSRHHQHDHSGRKGKGGGGGGGWKGVAERQVKLSNKYTREGGSERENMLRQARKETEDQTMIANVLPALQHGDSIDVVVVVR